MASIEMHGVEKAYGENRVLRGLDLTVEEGEIFSLLGPNGARADRDDPEDGPRFEGGLVLPWVRCGVRNRRTIVRRSFEERRGQERFAEPAPREFTACYKTFCGT